MFQVVKSFKKANLKLAAEEIGKWIPLYDWNQEGNNFERKEYEQDTDFVKEILLITIAEWKERLEQELEKKVWSRSRVEKIGIKSSIRFSKNLVTRANLRWIHFNH